MDWSLRPRRGSILLVLGFVLLLNPLAVGHFDLGDPDHYRYESARMTFHGNGTYDAPTGTRRFDSDVACLNYPPRRACMLERAIHANGGVSYEDGASKHFLWTEYDHVFVYGEGFYRPVAEELPNETVHYDLQRVPMTEALDYVATPIDRASPGVRRAIRSGSFETSDELPGANELVRADGGYYVVYPAAYRVENGSERSSFVVFLQWVLGFLGGWLVLGGQRRRVRDQR